MRWVLLTVACTLTVAGCLESSSDPPQALGLVDAAPPPAPQGPVVHSKSGAIGAGLGASAAGAACWAEVGADLVLKFNVPAGTKALVVELDWDDPLQDLTLSVSPPSAANQPCPPNEYVAEGTTGMRDFPRLVLLDPEPGAWSATGQANGVVYGVQYTTYASVFAGDVPEDYSAL